MTTIRVGIAVLVAFAVLSHGAVENWSRSVLAFGAAALFLLWAYQALRRGEVEIRWSPFYLPMAGFGALVLAQALAGLSVYPHLTRVELLKLSVYGLLFFLAIQAYRTGEQARPFVWFLLIFGFGVALFGIIQFFTFNEKLYWFRALRQGGNPFGPFVNRNHFAGLMEMTVPMGLALLFLRALRRDKLPLVGLFTIIPIGALFLSASRGGIFSFLFQLGLMAYLVRARQAGKGGRPLAAGFLVILLAGAFVVWLGVGPAFERFAEFWTADLSQERRLVMLQDTWRIFLDHPWTGTGAGTLVTVYPQYASVVSGRVVDHAHNDYVEMLAETGLIGALFSAAFLFLLFWTGLSKLQTDQTPFALAVRAGALVACSGLLLHGLVDFNLHIPSNALLFFLLASLATMEHGDQRKAASPP